MGKQSSRIIWGRTGEDGNDKTPITMYDPNETIYVKDNYTIVRVREYTPSGQYAYVTALYRCDKIESQGEWDDVKDEWTKIESVKEYSKKKPYKKGDKCIYLEFVWECTHEITNSDIIIHIHDDDLVPTSLNYWKKAYQTTSVEFMAMDHKEIYYDDGRNRCKWHRAMWFVPPEDYFDEEHEEEIKEFNSGLQYRLNDQVIRTFNYVGGTVRYLYKCIVQATTYGGWHVNEWERVANVTEWVKQTAYNKGDYVIHSEIPYGNFNVVLFRDAGKWATFKPGDYVINTIDKHDLDDPTSDEYRQYMLLPDKIKTKVEEIGAKMNAVYCLKQGVTDPDMDNFQRNEWTLTNTAFDLFLGSDYPKWSQVIWSYTSTSESDGVSLSSYCVFTAQEDLYEITYEQTPSADPSKWGEPWRQQQDGKPQEHLYKAIKDITAGMSAKFRKEYWAVQSQMTKANSLGWYGWVWKKLDEPDNGGIPFYAPLLIHARQFDEETSYPYRHGMNMMLDQFYPSINNNILNKKALILGSYTEYSSDPTIDDIMRNGVNVLLCFGYKFIGFYVNHYIDNFLPDQRPLATQGSHVLISDDGKDFAMAETDYAYSLGFSGYTHTIMPYFVDGIVGFLYFTKRETIVDSGQSYYKETVRKAIIGVGSNTIVNETLFKTFQWPTNWISIPDGVVYSDYIPLSSDYSTPGYILYYRTLAITALEINNNELTGRYSTAHHSTNEYFIMSSEGVETSLGFLQIGSYEIRAKVLDLDQDNIWNLLTDIRPKSHTYYYTQQSALVPPSIAEANIQQDATWLDIPYTADSIEYLDIDLISGGSDYNIFTSPNGQNLYLIEALDATYYESANGDVYSCHIMTLKIYNSYSSTFATVAIANDRMYNPSLLPNPFPNNPWFDIKYLYYFDDSYAYFANLDNTSDYYGYNQLNLLTGAVEHISTPLQNEFGIIRDIGPCKDEPVKVTKNGLNYYIRKVNVYFLKTFGSQSNLGYDPQTETLTIYADPIYYINSAFASSVTGANALAAKNSWTISDEVLLQTDYNVWGVYGIVVYIPIFNGLKIDSGQAFFWLNDELDTTGGPFFGGNSTPGFEGWYKRQNGGENNV